MKKIWGYIIGIILWLGILSTGVYAVNTNTASDKIENMVITVDPRMKDGSLDIQYEVTWKVLKDWGDKPLRRVSIGAPGFHFNQLTILSDNIEKISKNTERARVQIDFKTPYKAGESVTFKYSIHQKYIGIESGAIYRVAFSSPLVFVPIDSLTIKWKADYVAESDCHSQEENYLIWKQENMQKKDKLMANVRYDKKDFKSIANGVNHTTQENIWKIRNAIGWVIFIGIIVAIYLVKKYQD